MARGLLLLVLLTLFLLAGSAAGQETFYLVPLQKREKAIEVIVQTTAPNGRPGGYGYVTVRLVNRGELERTIRLVLSGQAFAGGELRIRRSSTLGPAQEATVHLAIPATASYCHMQVTCREFQPARGIRVRQTGGSEGLVALAVGRNEIRRSRWDDLVSDALAVRLPDKRPRRGASWFENLINDYVERRPLDLPDDWVMLTRFDLVLLDCTTPGITKQAQRVLSRYVSGGGRLLLYRPEVLPPGALKELHDQGTVNHDFGTMFSITAAAEQQADFRNKLGSWLSGTSVSFLAKLANESSGPLPDGFFQRLHVPGIGELPTSLFFMIILVFAILVGPLNHWYFRRRRQPWMVLVTVPVCGLVVTVTILVSGAFAEGFAIRGNLHTFSYLDQTQHRLVQSTSRTLYAPLSPQHLQISPGTCFMSAGMLTADAGGTGTVFDLDEDTGVLDGSILPSRTETSMVTVSQAVCRDRLKFHRRKDGAFEVKHDGRLVPRADVPAAILRDFDGRFYLDNGGGVLRPAVPGDIKQVYGAWCRAFLPGLTLQTNDGRGYRYSRRRRSRNMRRFLSSGFASTGTWTKERLPWPLPNGWYVARLERFAAVETLGLDPTYDSQVHLLVGKLAKEDIVE